MLSVLCTWLIITVMSFLAGFAVLQPMTVKFQYRVRHASSYIVAGLTVLTVYAQIFSLFGKVGALCFLIPAALCIPAAILFRKQIPEFLKTLKKPVGEWVALGCAVLLFAYASSRGYMAYDTALYHAQAIRWIEEFGVVPGEALFHFRLGYNSASFALSALFSFSWTGLQPMHCMAGYFLLLLASPVIKIYEIILLRRIRFSDFLRVGVFYYITLVLFEVVAPASDFFATSMVFFVAYTYATLAEDGEKSEAPYALVSVLALYAVTMKFSAGFMAFLVIKPVIILFREKKWKRILFYVALGLVVLLPTLIRGYIISGWPLYPSTALGFFHPEWQLPAEIAARDAAEIKAWGQKLPELGNYNATFREWFRYWFDTESLVNKVFLILDAIGILVTFTVFPALTFLKNPGNKTARRRDLRDYLLLLTVLGASFFLWFFAAPLIRYGYAFFILPGICFLGFFHAWYFDRPESLNPAKKQAPKISKIHPLVIVLGVFFSAFFLYKGGMMIKEGLSVIKLPYYITAMDYEEYPTVSYEVNGLTFYRPESGDQTGYKNFPAGPSEFGYYLRGNSLKEGFKTNP